MSEKYLNLTGLGTLWAKVKARLATKQDDISDILPTDASASNRLATKAYADAIGERLEARYLGSDASGNPFPSHAALAGATAYYYQGSPATPDTNDITTVTSDEDHPGDTGQPSTTRYRWNGAGWSFEYVINNTGLSESQLLAVNSGITATKVAGYDGLDAKIAAETGARTAADAAKLNVDGSNATEAGVTAMMRKVPGGSATLSDESSYFGDSSADHARIVRRPVTDIWNYVKGKIGSWLGADVSASGQLLNSSATLSGGAVQRSHGTANVNCWAAVATRTDTGNEVAFGIGSGGQNRGIWDEARGAWAFKIDSSGNDSIPGWASVGNSGEPVYFDSSGRPVSIALLNTRQNAGYATTSNDSTRKAGYGLLLSVSTGVAGGNSTTRIVSGEIIYATTGNAVRGTYEIWYRRNSGAFGTINFRIRWQGGNNPSSDTFHAAVYDSGQNAGENIVFRLYMKSSSNYHTYSASVDSVTDLDNGVLNVLPTYYENSFSTAMTGTGNAQAVYLSSGDNSGYKIVVGSTGTDSDTLYFS